MFRNKLKLIKMKRITLNLIILLIGMSIPFMAKAQQTYQIKSHSLIVSGTSNLHDWTANVEKVNGNFKVKVDDSKIIAVSAFELKVDATSLKGSKGGIMNTKIIDALDAKKYPSITFKSGSGNVIEKSGTYKVTSNGILTIAGKSQNISVDASGKILPNGDLEFTGTKKLKMTDYNIDPPTAMLGTMTTGDEITLTFKIVLKTV